MHCCEWRLRLTHPFLPAPDLSAGAYKYALLQKAVREAEICAAFTALRALQIEPILLKGWSVARHYPDPATRHLGDIDLMVRKDHLGKAKQACQGNIDWHTG